MAVLPIRSWPDPVLREPAAPVDEVTDDVRKLVTDMGETMIAAPGVGLAAPQVGVQRRVLVYRATEEDPIRALIDPTLTLSEDTEVDEEACLSLPGLSYEVPRATSVHVRAMDIDGQLVEFDSSGFQARVIQHEVDHLDGILFIDRIDEALRKEALRVLRTRDMETPAFP